MHLMFFIEVAKPNFLERLLVIFAQSIFWFYFFLYVFFPRTAHRMIHYFEDEAVKSYSEYLSLVQKGVIENINAKIAIEYYNLDNDAKLSDMIIRVREDEMRHSEKTNV